MKTTLLNLTDIIDDDLNIIADKYKVYIDVRKIINLLDPMKISYVHEDEYQLEINEIMQKLIKVDSISLCLDVIFKVFYNSFGNVFYIDDYKKYVLASKKLLKIKKKYNIIEKDL